LLVIEVKTDLVSVEETLRKHDEKVRLAPGIAERQFGWRPTTAGRLLVLPDNSTPRRRLARHAGVLRTAYPVAGGPARTWIRTPAGPLDGSSSSPSMLDERDEAGRSPGAASEGVNPDRPGRLP
jgi:hypothetical protein